MKRLLSFDMLKLFAIFLVIWGHSIAFLSNGDFEENEVYLWIYSFHMPLFMVISGYFFAGNSVQKPISTILKQKAVQLILPCIVWGVPIWLVSMHLNSGNHNTNLLYDLSKTLFENFWFLKSLFICYILGTLSYKSHSGGGYIVTLIIVQFIPLFHLEIMYPCFLFGMLMKRKDEVFMKRLMTVIALSTTLYWGLYFAFWNSELLHTLHLRNELLSIMNIEVIGSRLIRIVIGLFASVSLMLLFRQIFNRNSFTAISIYGQLTLGIYILQSILLERLLLRLIHIDNMSEYIFNYVGTPLVSIAVLIVSAEVVKLINRNSYLKLMLLGQKKWTK